MQLRGGFQMLASPFRTPVRTGNRVEWGDG